MGDLKNVFNDFFQSSISGNKPTYRNIKIDDIETEYNASFPSTPLFEAIMPQEEYIKIIENNRKNPESTFFSYSQRTGNHAPRAILGNYIKFLQFYDINVEFTGLQNLVDIIHE